MSDQVATSTSEHVVCHHRLILGSGRVSAQHPEVRWVNALMGNLKTAITGTYHAFKFRKYAHRYLAEFQYRINRRFDLLAILAQLETAAIATVPRPERVLRGVAEVRR
nr:transposase [Methyloterricola oryzae]